MPDEIVETEVSEEIETEPEVTPADMPDVAEVLAAKDEKSTVAGKEEVEKPAVPAYTPNLKFKVLDQEKEFDEWARPFVTKDNEAKLRELYEKAYGLDVVKPKLHEERMNREQLQKTHTRLQTTVSKILGFKDQDLDLFFHHTKVSPDAVMQWAYDRAQQMEALKDLPDGMKKRYNEYGTQKIQNNILEQQLEELSTGSTEADIHARTQQLSTELSRPEISAIVQAYDSRRGKPGSFQQLVIRHGRDEYDTSEGKRDLSATEAVKEVLDMLGLSPQTDGKSVTPNEPATPKVVQSKKPTVLPNLGAGAGATAVARPKNLDELRKISKAAQG